MDEILLVLTTSTTTNNFTNSQPLSPLILLNIYILDNRQFLVYLSIFMPYPRIRIQY